MGSLEDENDTGFGNHMPKELSQSLANGTKFVDEVLSGQSDRCLENFRMDKQVFYKLCDILQAKGLLRHTNRIKIEEQLAIFLFIIGHNLRTRAVQELFRYSGETISRHFNNVLNAITGISLDFFNPPGSDIPAKIVKDPRFYPYFKDCVGAVDGIHVPVMVGVDEQGPFRNKNGLLSQNVLAACSFDLKFHYVLAGWEGSASDLRTGKYYLVDDKFANMPGFIAPYPGVQEQISVGYRNQDARELFNQRHSALRSATDRTFGALKARFPILMAAPPYPLQTQVKLVIAACALHNYIRMEKPDDLIFRKYEEGSVVQIEKPLDVQGMMVQAENQGGELGFKTDELEFSSHVRESIASDIWEDYIRD
ncbi:Putative nuclease HARBI1 [Linum perenne]